MKRLLLLFFLAFQSLLFAQDKSTIEILNADLLEFGEDSTRGKIKKLIGRVALQDNDVLLICDSAYLYEDSSDFEAFSNVKIKKADSLTIYSDYLYYDKGKKVAELDGNVIIDNKEILLKTDKLFYYIGEKYAYYPTPGYLTHPDFNLFSKQGYYYEKYQYASFIEEAKIKGDDYVIVGDTINYYYKKKTSYFNGPTSIQTDSMTGFGNSGYHIPQQNILYLEKDAWVQTTEHYINADTLLFNDSLGTGYARKDVIWKDSSQTRIIYGQNLDYDKKNSTTLISDNAIFENVMDNDTFYMYADTMYAFETFVIEYDSIYQLEKIDTFIHSMDSMTYDSIFYLDSIHADTIHTKAIRAHYDVKILHKSMSGIADSMLYLMYDSTFRFYTAPYLWTDSTQMNGDSLHIQIKNQKIHRLYVFNNTAIGGIVLEEYFYNQIVGDKITGYFHEDTLRNLMVNGNAESIYFITDNVKRFVGANKGESASIAVRFKNNNINQVVFIEEPKATFLPMNTINPKTINFPNFAWMMQYKPITFEDLSKPGRYKVDPTQLSPESTPSDSTLLEK